MHGMAWEYGELRRGIRMCKLGHYYKAQPFTEQAALGEAESSMGWVLTSFRRGRLNAGHTVLTACLVSVPGVWCLVSGVWCLVSGVWCLVSGVWCLVSGVWCLVSGVWL
ncbi:hypothetical protein UVI_02008890 [Ustilaginoidea virens]|uniref:Uncharacterized protein n=1 Tax=Ustilaginoidea virens TaxID=1159556 RepID=A0A1B5KUK7_USTVR|nr:hypothetical protein UVI_02008890 [Ustilaginoidea virens]